MYNVGFTVTGAKCIFGQNNAKIMTRYLRPIREVHLEHQEEDISDLLKGEQIVISFSDFYKTYMVIEFFSLQSKPCVCLSHYYTSFTASMRLCSNF